MRKDNSSYATNELKNGIVNAGDLKLYMLEHADSLHALTLPEYLDALLEKKGLRRADVIEKSNLERSFGYQIFKGTRKPTRDKVLQLAIGFGLNCEETSELLRAARQADLYPRLKRDAVIMYCISHHLSILDTENLLASEGCSTLVEESEKG